MPPVKNMGYLSEKAAYLKGLTDGLKIGEKNDEGKVILKLIDLMEEMAASIEELEAVVDEHEDRLDDLDDFAEEVCDCFSDCDCDCDEHDGCSCCDDDDLDDDLDDLEFYEVECPHCSEKVYFDEDMIDSGDLVCPNCNEVIEMEIDV